MPHFAHRNILDELNSYTFKFTVVPDEEITPKSVLTWATETLQLTLAYNHLENGPRRIIAMELQRRWRGGAWVEKI
jgi:hypothetical protein